MNTIWYWNNEQCPRPGQTELTLFTIKLGGNEVLQYVTLLGDIEPRLISVQDIQPFRTIA